MRDLLRATIQFACEVTIYACERILETLAAGRPDMDDPLPDGAANVMPGPLDDFYGWPLDTSNAIRTESLHLPGDWS